MTATVGWVITRSYSSGFTEFLVLQEDSISWTTINKNCSILRDRIQAENIMSQLKSGSVPFELVPVEIHI